jgi:hypothetical protein
MDDLAASIEALLNDSESPLRGRFDFTHFNTHPCKALTMQRAAEMQMEQAEQAFQMGAVPDGPGPF